MSTWTPSNSMDFQPSAVEPSVVAPGCESWDVPHDVRPATASAASRAVTTRCRTIRDPYMAVMLGQTGPLGFGFPGRALALPPTTDGRRSGFPHRGPHAWPANRSPRRSYDPSRSSRASTGCTPDSGQRAGHREQQPSVAGLPRGARQTARPPWCRVHRDPGRSDLGSAPFRRSRAAWGQREPATNPATAPRDRAPNAPLGRRPRLGAASAPQTPRSRKRRRRLRPPEHRPAWLDGG